MHFLTQMNTYTSNTHKNDNCGGGGTGGDEKEGEEKEEEAEKKQECSASNGNCKDFVMWASMGCYLLPSKLSYSARTNTANDEFSASSKKRLFWL